MSFDVTRDLDLHGAAPAAGLWALIVCERSGHWATRLRDVLDSDLVPICETRSARECLAQCERFGASACVLEMTDDNVETVLSLLTTLARGFPRAAAVILAQRGLEPLGRLAIELGAVHFAVATRDLAPVAGILRRHRATVPAPGRTTLSDRILDSLPWGRDEPSSETRGHSRSRRPSV